MEYLLVLFFNIIFAVWVHYDAKKIRMRGVPITPGLWSTLVFLGSIPLFIIYILVRLISYSPKIKDISVNYEKPLSPSPSWTNWLTIIILFIMVGGILLSIIVVGTIKTKRNNFTQSSLENVKYRNSSNDLQNPIYIPTNNSNTFFDISQVKVGQKVGEFTVVDIKRVQEPSPGYKNYTLVEFEGSTTISGNFSYIRPYENPGLDYWLGFKIDEKSQPLIPKTDGWGVGGAIQINVINQKDMSSYFKEDSQGYVEMAVKNPKIYYHHYRPGQSVGGAQNTEVEVEKIIKIIEK